MPLSDHILDRARGGDRDACLKVLVASFPSIARMSIALTGDYRLADRVARRVLKQGARQIRRWSRVSMPENWFYHHTLLATRDVAPAFPVASTDEPLIDPDLPPNSEYAAFVRALRGLPQQQREAFILHHGERFNARHLGVTMDCSADAALSHLAAATDAMNLISGPSVNVLLTAFSNAYWKLSPTPESIPESVERFVPAYANPVRRRIWLRRAAIAAIAIGLIACWHWRGGLLAFAQHWVSKLRDTIGM